MTAQTKNSQPNTKKTTRPPIVVIMGHVDHGKSTLLDYIRKSNITEGEAGGITQHIDAYQVTLPSQKIITFIDTPGHEAFSNMRARGAQVADIAVLVVAADEGVKAQTLETLKTITEAKIPYVVAINKIDKSGANSDRTKQALAEAGVLIEGYGGTIPAVEISAKTGAGVPELLEMILLVADLEEITADPTKAAEGNVIESHLDPKKGISGTLIVTDGTLRRGESIVVETDISPIRVLENFLGESVDEAGPGMPVRVSGFSKIPKAGETFAVFESKKEAAALIRQGPASTRLGEAGEPRPDKKSGRENKFKEILIPAVIKADTLGTLEAIRSELAKVETDRVGLKVVSEGVGTITEADIKDLSGKGTSPLVIGFNVPIDAAAKDLAEKHGITPQIFDIIYKLSEWMTEEIARRTPKITKEVELGRVKILKIFSQNKDKQIIGGHVVSGVIEVGKNIQILRRDKELGRGKITDLEIQRIKTPRVEEGKQCGITADSKITIAEGDYLVLFDTITE